MEIDGREIIFQSTQPEWAATRAYIVKLCNALQISIHAARVGCDEKYIRKLIKHLISIHAARVGCDLKVCVLAHIIKYFNPRSPSGLRLLDASEYVIADLFQSTQPEWAATVWYTINSKRCVEFQSTQPEWAATFSSAFHTHLNSISIHAARVGCDDVLNVEGLDTTIISIHAARVGCDNIPLCNLISPLLFQSTQPEWAATDL